MIDSPDVATYDLKPEMSVYGIRDTLLDQIRDQDFGLIVVNLVNCDMVGHTGHYVATISAVQAVDLGLERVRRAVERAGGVLVVTADHGNSDDMYMTQKGEILRNEDGSPKPKTSHSLNPVYFIVYDPQKRFVINESVDRPGLGNNAATIINLLGYEAPEHYLRSLVVVEPSLK